jgi:uncharacterized protein (DUF4415 family)
MKKSSGSSQRAKPRSAKSGNTRISSKTVNQEMKALMSLRDEDINTSDIPEVNDWSAAVVGKFYRPRKEPITVRLDADVIAWLKAGGPGYQTRMNTLLRHAMKAPSGTRSRKSARQR